jgi:hypothetical protein
MKVPKMRFSFSGEGVQVAVKEIPTREKSFGNTSDPEPALNGTGGVVQKSHD